MEIANKFIADTAAFGGTLINVSFGWGRWDEISNV